MSDYPATNEDMETVRGLMASGLTIGPKHNTARVLAKAKVQRRRSRAVKTGLVAAVLLCLYTMSPLVLPALARAISAVPGVGPGFEQALKLHSLDLAYEAGLLASLDKSSERDGVTFTVHSAYRDSQTFDILLSIAGERDFVKALAEGIGPRVSLDSGRWKAEEYYFQKLYDGENDVLYFALSSSEPLPWHVRKLSVSVEWMVNEEEARKYTNGVVWDMVELSEPITVSFPLQQMTDEHTQVIPINKTIASGDTTVILESLMLNPVRSILKYTYTGPMPVLELIDENGKVIRSFVGGTKPGAAHHICEATESKEVAVRLRGHFVDYEVEVPLQEGYEHRGEPSFRIESITPANQRLDSLVGNGEDYYADTKVVLSWDRQDWVSVYGRYGDAEMEDEKITLYLIREGLSLDEPLTLIFSRLGGEPQEVKITR